MRRQDKRRFRRVLRRAALLCAWSSDLRLKCLFSTFLSTSRDDFEALGANLSALGSILEPLGAHLGGSGGGSGGSWGGLWGVRGSLGAILGRLGAILEAILRQRDFRMFFASILGPSWAPKGGSNGAQVGAKTDQNRRRKRRCQKKFFKLVLGRSWSRLGAVLGRS